MLACAVLLAGCGTTNDEPTRPRVVETTVVEEAPQASPVEALLQRAERANPVEAAGFYLQAARLVWADGDIAGTEDILARIDTEALDAIRMEGILLLQAEVAATKDDHEGVMQLLSNANFRTLERLSDAQRVRFGELRATAMFARGEPGPAIAERIRIDTLLPPEEQVANHDKLWRALRSLSEAQLDAGVANANDDATEGWYRLAQITYTWSDDLDRQLIELRRWRNEWQRHAAALVPPAEIELAETVARERPQNLALLLPLGIEAGATVRDAFMSAYFNVLERGGQVPTIRVYDTGTTADGIVELHQRARAEGAQLVIGPLLKPQVALLQQEADLGVPTLALNNNEGVPTNAPQLYQFALSPEGEARQIAQKAWADGHRYAAILSPIDDVGNDPFARKRDSFIAEWQRLGGRVVTQSTYRDSYTDTISGMLSLDASTARMDSLRKLIGRPLLFVQRRRQDIDFIYLIAEPGPARQIVPSLAYLYAGDIPVYASQDIYSGIARPLEDRDLNGVTFGESPWLLGTAGNDAERIRALFPATTANNMRLQAFGVDAFRLYPRLRLMESSPEGRLPGATGMLRLGNNRNIERELTWAAINAGVAQAARP
jgi:outer membrane PBP1 activator LpoA protein